MVKNEDEAYKLVEPNDFVYNPMNVRLSALAKHKKDYSVKVSKYYDVFALDKSVNLVFVEFFLKSYNSIQYYDHMAEGVVQQINVGIVKEGVQIEKNN